jgi:hypothetical protein
MPLSAVRGSVLPLFRRESWLHIETQLGGRLPYPCVEAEHREITDRGSPGERRGKVDRIERADRLPGERPPGSVDYGGAEPHQMPAGCDAAQRSPARRRLSFGDFAEGNGSNQYSIALDQRELRRDDYLSVLQQGPNASTY